MKIAWPLAVGLLITPSLLAQTVVYVDQDAAGPVHDGSSWCSAYTEAYEALAVATPGTIIRVADGIYHPDPTGLDDPREATFQLLNDVTLEGGFAGCGADAPDERDVGAFQTILDGDVNDDDDPNGDPGPGGGCCGAGAPGCDDSTCLAKVCAVEPSCCGDSWFLTCERLAQKWCCELCGDNLTHCDNSYHVVTGSGTNDTAALDGFVITGGRAINASGGGFFTGGGGMIIVSGDPTIANCTFTANWSEGVGGAVSNFEGAPTFENCTFHANTAGQFGSGGFGGGMYNLNGAAILRECTFAGNVADELGGGLYTVTFDANPTVESCTFVENRADVDGGGMYVEHGSPYLSGCTFLANWANIHGGGLYTRPESSLRLSDCAFRQNSAEEGGGMYNRASNTFLVKCVFSQNTAWGGGGLYNGGNDVHLINCMLSSNTANGGGGILNGGVDLALTGCILDGNSARRSGGALAGDATLTDCTITGNSAGEIGGGMYGTGSLTNCTITGNWAGQIGGGMYGTGHLDNCILWGNSSRDGTTESAQIAWLGANPPLIAYSCIQGLEVYGGNHNIDRDPLLADPRYGNVHIQSDSPCVDAGRNTDTLGDFDMDGEPRIQPPGGTVDIGADESDGTDWAPGPYTIVRVRPEGNNAHDGSSWALAKRTVQAGIDAASALGGEVWVQAGTYEECITLHPYAHVYGGFVGGETARDERDWDANVTTLDGRQQGSVVTVRTGQGVSAMDGFTITNGTGTKSHWNGPTYGGGLYLEDSSPAIANNTIVCNSAGDGGGGLLLSRSSATITRNTITGNNAGDNGGGLYLEDSSPMIANNTITGNNAGDNGGGLYLAVSSPTIANNRITGNSASSAGGLYLGYKSSPTIANNTITGNIAGEDGGGLYLDGSSPTISNNAITSNGASSGGGLYLWASSPTITNSTITGNFAFQGGGFFLSWSSPTMANNTITGNSASEDGGAFYIRGSVAMIANTIVAFNSSGIFHDEYGSITTLRYTSVYGNTAYDYSGLTDPTGTDGNISADPLFIRNPDDGGDGWGDDPHTPDVDEGANDDFGDLRLLFGSPSIDAGDNDAVPPDDADLDGDGDVDEPIPFDLGGFPRFVDDPDTPDTGNPGELGPPIVDMGAYEYQLPVMAPLDIIPGRCPNRLPLKKQGMLRIALLSTDSFDVSWVDLDSLILTRGDGVGGAIAPLLSPPGLAPEIRDLATPFEGELCDCHHAGQDGLDDLLLRFAGGRLIRTLQLESVPAETSVELTLSGTLQDGTAFEGSDCVLIRPPAGKSHRTSPQRRRHP